MGRAVSEIIGSLMMTMIVISLFAVVYAVSLPQISSFLGNVVYSTSQSSQQVQTYVVVEAISLNGAKIGIYVYNAGLVPAEISAVFVNGVRFNQTVTLGVDSTACIQVSLPTSLKPPYQILVFTQEGFTTGVTWP
ncbi:MAG: hypothetical protein ACP5UI_02250 [Thermoprotei archaeon]|nr:hypothetical protein [TACK group archaeon]